MFLCLVELYLDQSIWETVAYNADVLKQQVFNKHVVFSYSNKSVGYFQASIFMDSSVPFFLILRAMLRQGGVNVSSNPFLVDMVIRFCLAQTV